MKRTFALVVLLTALGVLSKLTLKDRPARPEPAPGEPGAAAGPAQSPGPADIRATLAAKYQASPAGDRELVARVADRFRQTAVSVERTDGLRGLRLLDRLDLEAVYLYDKHPAEFRRLRDILDDDAAADVLLHWREYFGLKRADDTDRGILIAELAGLSASQRKLAARYPNALPLILADSSSLADLVESFRDDERDLGEALTLLSLISLENGASDLRSAVRTVENHRSLALEAFRVQGLEGFALVGLYGPVLEAAGGSPPLDQALILLQVNSEYVDELLRTHRPETVAGHLGHVAARGLVAAAGSSPNALRLAVEFGEAGERALEKAGPDAADVVFSAYSDPALRPRAVAALGEHGAMALVILDKYATDPDFQQILKAYGPAVIPPVAAADTGPEALAYLQAKEKRTLGESLAKLALLATGDNGQAVIRTIKEDGLSRVESLASNQVRFYQFLPLYDVTHLANVLASGHTPTSGEMTWALVDGCFVVADVLSLAAIQPEGAAAAELARAEVKAAVREGSRSVGRDLAEAGAVGSGKAAGSAAAQAASRKLGQWWAVRSAGGFFRILERLPEALPKMSLEQVAAIGRPLCAKAGLRLSAWKPVRLLRDGATVVFQIPPRKGLKYLGAQVLQASVGVVGIQKIEEHLASRRPKTLPHSDLQP
ncbi:hypothetical protein OJF2_46920 [Aquisphaera giovannonii]|uniref:Uncharacterized protein n=1 Tax=Aquisphaera giovannonii TaxID=406548 RepID=A0A5B9W650_9BACT|nr:hypothetical protein [Aquisphaera giovannonii]QEH36132.1 hypothetical protein OJF2_46920 [Aquisphaera giovannonii]